MNTVIKRISEIEDAASAIMESANASKKSFAQEMEKRTRESRNSANGWRQR